MGGRTDPDRPDATPDPGVGRRCARLLCEQTPVRLLLVAALLSLAVAALSYGAFALAAAGSPPAVGRSARPWWYELTLVTTVAAPVGVGLLLAAAGAWFVRHGESGSTPDD